MQAGFKADQVRVIGRFNDFARVSDEADRKEQVFHFCPACGSQVFYTESTEPDLVVVSAGSFADPEFPPADAGRPTCGTAAAKWPGTTRTSTRSATSRRSRLSSSQELRQLGETSGVVRSVRAAARG